MSRLIDISPLVSARCAVWPGDTPFSYAQSLRLDDGASVTLGAIKTTVHVGAHADAPSHYVLGGRPIDQCPLLPYYGPCEVMAVRAARGKRIEPEDLPTAPTHERLLLKTGSSPLVEVFNEDFNSLSPRLVEYVARRGVCLIGIDTPSVDPCHDKLLESHRAVARHGVTILEGLDLTYAAPGSYTLIALPLKIEGADASPVRAVLVLP
jgi:arylformamidase